jgi:hypothetical protein
MLSQVLSMVLSAAAPAAADQAAGAPNPNAARQAYSRCLSGLVKDDLRQKVAPDAFAPKLAAACKAEEAAFRAAIVRDDLARRVARAMAEQGAAEQVDELRVNAAETYKSYFEAGAAPR